LTICVSFASVFPMQSSSSSFLACTTNSAYCVAPLTANSLQTPKRSVLSHAPGTAINVGLQFPTQLHEVNNYVTYHNHTLRKESVWRETGVLGLCDYLVRSNYFSSGHRYPVSDCPTEARMNKCIVSGFWAQPCAREVRAAVFLGLYSFVGH